MRCNHGKRDITQSPHSHGVRGSEGKENVRCGRDSYPFGLEYIAQGELKSSSSGVDGHGFWPGFCLDLIKVIDNRVVGFIPCDSLELIGTFGPHALQWMAESMFGIDNLRGMFPPSADHPQGMPLICPNVAQPTFFQAHLYPTSGRTNTANSLFPRFVFHVTLSHNEKIPLGRLVLKKLTRKSNLSKLGHCRKNVNLKAEQVSFFRNVNRQHFLFLK